MTRKEEIKQSAFERFVNNKNGSMNFIESQYEIAKVQAFVIGAKWADTTMIYKACEWLKDNLYNSLDRDGRTTIDSPSCTNVNEFIEEFRKAMEGGCEKLT